MEIVKIKERQEIIYLSENPERFKQEVEAVLKLNERRESGSLTFRLVQKRIAIGYSQTGALPSTDATTDYVNNLKREIESLLN